MLCDRRPRPRLGSSAVRHPVAHRCQLDDLLSNRERLNQGLELMLDTPALDRGVQIDRVEIKDVALPETMKRSMSRQAEAERERRSRVITAEGELQASRKLAQAAVLPFPVELLRFLERSTPPDVGTVTAAAGTATEGQSTPTNGGRPDQPRRRPMTRREKPGPVVVGVDEAGSADDAVDWATAEAAARGCPLRVVHAFRPPLPADAYGFASPIDSFATAHTAAQLILGDAVTRVRSVAPGVEVSTRLARGTAARVLLDEARDARLLVLGSRGRSALRAVLSGSVAGPVSRHSPCPIVVIRPFANRPADRVGSAPRVVVGIDPTASRAAAIDFAFHAASQRGIPITVLSAWTPDTAADIETIPGPPHIAEAAAGRAVQQTLAPWREEFPTVPVITTLVRADPASALITESSGAALLVVGSSRRGHLRGLLCGSVSRTVLRDAGCPVAIVGRDRTTAGRTTAARTRAEDRDVSPPGSGGRPRRQVFWIRRASQ